MPIRSTLTVLAALVLAMPADAQQTAEPVILEDKTEAAEVSAKLPSAVFNTPRLAAHLTREAEREMTDFAEHAADAHRQSGEADYWRDWTLEIDHKVAFQNARLISVLRQSWFYTGGAHGNLALDSVNYHRTDERTITLADIFGDVSDSAPVLKAMAAHARDKLNEKLGEATDPEWIAEGTPPNRTTFDAFTFVPSTEPGKAGGIRVHFAPYAVAAYAAGPQHVTIPHSVFADYVKRPFTLVFAGKPARDDL